MGLMTLYYEGGDLDLGCGTLSQWHFERVGNVVLCGTPSQWHLRDFGNLWYMASLERVI